MSNEERPIEVGDRFETRDDRDAGRVVEVMHILKFPWGRPPLNANQRLHWAAKSRLTKDIREVTAWLAKSAEVPAMPRCEVQLAWTVTDSRRRDEDNIYPTFKAMCDGLVDAGIVPDDTPDLMVKLAPVIERGDTAQLVLTVCEATA